MTPVPFRIASAISSSENADSINRSPTRAGPMTLPSPSGP